MNFVDLYPELVNTEGAISSVADADEAVHRLVFRRQAIAGLPETVAVGDVRIDFVTGPIRTQVVESRQRPEWPPVFDKWMRRGIAIGENEPLTVCQVMRGTPIDDVAQAMDECRAVAENAIGLVALTLDERIALVEIAEDMIFVRAGRPFAAADRHTRVRTFMPFDATEDDRAALIKLADTAVESPAAYAASLLLKGQREGPSATGFLFLWLAIDAVVATRRTQKAAVADALSAANADLSWLSLPLGRLVGLRGPIAHGRPVPSDELRAGYYDSEAIARLLVRHALGAGTAWPAAPTATAFPLPTGRQVNDQAGEWVTRWHDEALPPSQETPEPIGLPRVDAFAGGHNDWLRVIGAADIEQESRLRFWLMAAVNAAGIPMKPFALRIDAQDPQLIAVNADEIVLGHAIAADAGQSTEPRLAWRLCRLLAEMQVMRTGVESVDFGAFLIDFGGTWVAYREWVGQLEIPPDFLTRVDLDTASVSDVGATAGCAAAGDQQATAAIDRWIESGPEQQTDLRAVVGMLLPELRKMRHFAEFLDMTTTMVEAEHAAARRAEQAPPTI
jgi:hypothetical protein